MAVFVDDVEHSFKHRGRTMLMCHLWADTVTELMEFADRIGLQREWLQSPPKASWVHFDVSKGKKQVAMRAGAILTDRYGPSEHCARLNIANGDPAVIAIGERQLAVIVACRERKNAYVPQAPGAPWFA